MEVVVTTSTDNPDLYDVETEDGDIYRGLTILQVASLGQEHGWSTGGWRFLGLIEDDEEHTGD